MASTPLWQQLVFLLYQLPSFLVEVIGLVVAFIYLRRCSRAAILVIVGVGILLFSSLAGSLVTFLVIRGTQAPGGSGIQDFAWVFYVLQALASAVGLGLLIAAAFVGRRGEPVAIDEDIAPPGLS